MGTLFDQPVRDHLEVSPSYAEWRTDEIEAFAEKHSISIDTAIELFKLYEYKRRTDVMVYNGNIHDEQMAGLGELIKSFVDKVDFIANQIEEIKQRI